ncbi:MAG: ribosomal protein S18-alanine N-acetyltransferase [Ruminococcus sp.]
MRIEEMTADHLLQVAQLENNCFSHPWSLKSLESELNNDGSHFYVCVEDGRVLGYIGMNVVVDEGYIFNVAVDENARKRGIGTALINTLVTFAKKNSLAFLTLEVRQSNENAIRLYSNAGFVKVGERKNYYSAPTENAILMTKYF